MNHQPILVAGATGNLGGRIARELRRRGASVRAIARQTSDPAAVAELRELGVDVVTAGTSSVADVTHACAGSACVVSALSGLRDTIVDAQTVLLQAVIAAGVPRFIPSDYSIDYTRLEPGTNRNLDLRREFLARVDAAPIKATTIFSGMFAELLTGQAPVLLFKINRVLYWGDADQRMDFTTMDNTAEYTAAAALDPSTPRFLRIAGDQKSARELAAVASEVTGQRWKLLRPGGLGAFGALIAITRKLVPGREDVYPPWQGMQYLRNMLSGAPKLHALDNDRYPEICWSSVRTVLTGRAGVEGRRG
jgi:nucleoside-diphosphate-sugar epimerase